MTLTVHEKCSSNRSLPSSETEAVAERVPITMFKGYQMAFISKLTPDIVFVVYKFTNSV